MLTLQSNKEIRINKGDSGMAPLFINIGDNFRPIGYGFNLPIQLDSNIEDYTFYEDAWREHVVDAGLYSFIYQNGVWTLDNEEVDISKYGFVFNGELIGNCYINVTYNLIDNESTIYFEMWPILEVRPPVPLLCKKIMPKYNLVETRVAGDLISEEHINTVNSYGEILLKFNPADTESIERGEYLYQIRASLFNAYSNDYKFETITNRTPFYVIDDNFPRQGA